MCMTFSILYRTPKSKRNQSVALQHLVSQLPLSLLVECRDHQGSEHHSPAVPVVAHETQEPDILTYKMTRKHKSLATT